jgi:hypothetical protein
MITTVGTPNVSVLNMFSILSKYGLSVPTEELSLEAYFGSKRWSEESCLYCSVNGLTWLTESSVLLPTRLKDTLPRNPCLIPGRVKRFACPSWRQDRLRDPPNLLYNWYEGYIGGNSPPSSAEVKNGGAISPLPHTSSWLGAYFIVGYFTMYSAARLCSFDHRWIGKDFEESGRGFIRYYRGIYLERLRKTTKSLRQDTPYPGRDSNRVHSQ